MKLKPVLWLFLIATVLLGYIFLFERVSPALDADAQILFTDLAPRRVTSVEIVRENTRITARRENDRWILAGIEYPAQSTEIELLLETFQKVRQLGYIAPEEFLSQPGGLAAYGLDPARASVTWRQGTNHVTVRVGDKTPVRNQLYIQPVGSPGVHLASGELLQRIPLTADQWRDPRLLHAPLPIDRFELRYQDQVVDLERAAENSWRLVKPMITRADTQKVESLLQQIEFARVFRFVTDDPQADLEPFGLANPSVDLRLMRDTNLVGRLTFGASPRNEPDRVYARLGSHSNVVLVSRQLVDLLKLPHTELRDRSLVEFRPQAIQSIHFTVKDGVALVRDNEKWRITSPLPMPADAELVQQLLASLRRLEIAEFVKDVVTDFTEFGLDQPSRRYALFASVQSTNEPAALVEFGAQQTDKIYARRSDESSVYSVRAGDALRLPEAAYQLRDRQIIESPATNVVSISIQRNGQSHQLARNASGAWDANEVEDAAINEFAYRLAHLRAVKWVARGENQLQLFGFPNANLSLTLELASEPSPQKRIIHFGNLAPSGHVYAATTFETSGQPVIFEFPAPLYQTIVNLINAARAGAPSA